MRPVKDAMGSAVEIGATLRDCADGGNRARRQARRLSIRFTTSPLRPTTEIVLGWWPARVRAVGPDVREPAPS